MREENRLRRAVMISIAALCALSIYGCAEEVPENAAVATVETEAMAPVSLVVPRGAVLAVEFNGTISSADAEPGQKFYATIVDGVSIDDQTAIPAGAQIAGEIAAVQQSKKIGGRARLDLEFHEIQLAGGASVPISATFFGEGKSSTKKDAATIGGATVGGAILGRVIGHDRGEEADGTVIGAIVGAAVGTAIAATNEGEEVTIPAGTVVYLELDRSVEVPARV